MTAHLARWDAHAVRLIKDEGWRGMPEAAAIAILAAAHIPFSLLSLTFLDMLEQAGHRRRWSDWAQGSRPDQTLRFKNASNAASV